MTDALAHRGPDGEGIWINDSRTEGFGHRRLSIIDLSDAGAQPMPYLDRYTIVHNGEIYNYPELKESLQKKGYTFRSGTDTEVILAAYDCWKEECLDRFDGMFAFAIWDEKEKKLFAARDRFGEKPFFFFSNANQFVFASEMKALWAAGIEKKVNRKLLFNYLTIGYVDNPNIPEETFYEGIQKLPPATYLTYSVIQKQITLVNYWDIEVEKVNEKITDEKAIEQFGFLFQQSVKRRLRSDVPVGTSLSGGLDSSSVVARSKSFIPQNSSFDCFTASFPGFEKDETGYAGLVADQFQLNRHITMPDARGQQDDLEKIFYHQEEPFTSASIYSQYKVYELAKQTGIKVLLDGQGADETLGGYPKYYKWYWQELYRKKKLAGSREIQYARELGVTENFGWKNRVAALFPELATIMLERHYLVNALAQEDLSKDFVRLYSQEAYYTAPEIHSLNGVLYFNTCLHGLEELLRYADRNSMAHGREVRLPFLNHELVEFLFTLPSRFKIRNGWTKWVLRKSMANILPAEITWRKDKTGFEPPQKQWMQHPGMENRVLTGKQKLVDEKILNPDVMNKKTNTKDAYDADNFEWRYLTASLLFK
jgi:asparagine synthase (glutamine-hydrolysing)